MSEDKKVEATEKKAFAKGSMNALMVIGQSVLDKLEDPAFHYHLKPGYDARKALNCACEKMSNNPDTASCTDESVKIALKDMFLQGLDPAANQCYLIPQYNKVRGCMEMILKRSYFGTMAAVKELCPEITEINAACVWGDEKFAYGYKHGKFVSTLHELDPEKPIDSHENLETLKYVYVEIYGAKEKLIASEMMTAAQVKTAWLQSSNTSYDKATGVKSFKANSTHMKFTSEMAKRSVINRACKNILNTMTVSEDKREMYEAYKRTLENEFTEDQRLDTEPTAPKSENEAPASSMAEKMRNLGN
jgi:recombination protein RecT